MAALAWLAGCPACALLLPCCPGSLQAWLALLLALAALCLLIGYVRRPTISPLRRLLVESGASLVGDSKTKLRPD